MATKDFSSVQENMVANLLGWKVVAGSGAAACRPGDVINDAWLGECKTHVTPNHKILFNRSVWNKICKEASVQHRFPVLLTDDGSQKLSKTWCITYLHSVDLSNCTLHPYQFTIRSNLVFDHADLITILTKFQSADSDYLHAFELSWADSHLLLCDINTFAQLIS